MSSTLDRYRYIGRTYVAVRDHGKRGATKRVSWWGNQRPAERRKDYWWVEYRRQFQPLGSEASISVEVMCHALASFRRSEEWQEIGRVALRCEAWRRMWRRVGMVMWRSEAPILSDYYHCPKLSKIPGEATDIRIRSWPNIVTGAPGHFTYEV